MTQIYSVDVEIRAPVNATEVTDRVTDAITNVFPGADPTFRDGELVATVHELEHFSELLGRQEILDTARSVFFDRRRGDAFSFELKKQAAFEGRVNFVVGDPAELGDIRVRVTVNDPDVAAYVDHVAPPTEDGKPVETE